MSQPRGVTVTTGTILECSDPVVAAILINHDATLPPKDKFIFRVLDETHIFVVTPEYNVARLHAYVKSQLETASKSNKDPNAPSRPYFQRKG
ncbi:General transcription factor IIH subunit 5 [Blastocladiella emersonii ATCC 22665]|nr:General transcription factor IIH subunit 5 [Blastocladiella emersonii ATCC 22665]